MGLSKVGIVLDEVGSTVGIVLDEVGLKGTPTGGDFFIGVGFLTGFEVFSL